MQKKSFRGLSAEDYRHPLEKQMSLDMDMMGAIHIALDKASDICGSVCQQIVLGKYVEITESFMPEILNILKNVCKILNYHENIHLYVTHEYQPSCMQIGSGHMCILMPDLLLWKATEDMLYFILGNSVGMFKSGHIRLCTVNAVLPTVPQMIPFRLPLQAFQRAADLSSDRAGLLACQNITAAIRCIFWDLGMPPEQLTKIPDSEMQKMAIDYVEDLGHLWQGNLNAVSITWKKWNGTVSPGYYRLSELIQWYNSGYKLFIKNRSHSFGEEELS